MAKPSWSCWPLREQTAREAKMEEAIMDGFHSLVRAETAPYKKNHFSEVMRQKSIVHFCQMAQYEKKKSETD